MKPNTTQLQGADRKLQDGLRTHFSGARPITIAGKGYRPSGLVKILQAEIDAADVANAARLAWIAATKRSKQVQRDTAPVKRMLRAYIVSTFGESSTVLADFGMAPRKSRKKLTIEEKVVVVDKARATRAARHTMGTRQKQSIVGQAAAASTASGPTNGTGTKPPLGVT